MSKRSVALPETTGFKTGDSYLLFAIKTNGTWDALIVNILAGANEVPEVIEELLNEAISEIKKKLEV